MRADRRGVTLVELLATVAVLGVVLTLASQALVEQQAWRRRADLRALALIEVENTLERLAALGWDDLTPERLAAERLRDDAQKMVPGAELAASVDEQPGPPLAKRLRVELSWPSPQDARATNATIPPVRLTTWVFQHDR